MKRVRTDKLLKRRAKLILDYFFNVKGKLLIIFSLIFLISLTFCILTSALSFAPLNNRIAHYILGAVSIVSLLLIMLSLLRVFSSKINYQELEEIFESDRKVAMSQLFKSMALKNDRKDFLQEPIEIICPEKYPGRNTIVYRYEAAINKVFYSQTGYVWLLFGEKTFYYYHVSVNHVYGYVGYETGIELNYKDIVSVKTNSCREKSIESFVMTLGLVNGESIEIVLRNSPTKLVDSSTKALNDKEAQVVKVLRETIRNRK